MKIKDCIKGFNQGVSKVIPPEQTGKVVLRKMQNINPPILKRYFEVLRPSRIPQYRFIGTDYLQQVYQREGTNGKGHSKEQAFASGIMELAERYSCYKYLRNRNIFQISSFNDLKNNIFQLEDIYSNFIDERAYVRILKDKELEAAKIRWYEGYSLNGRKTYLPMSLIRFVQMTTNGMAAGNSLEEALLHAICEVIERHCLALIKVNKLKTPLINLSTVNSQIAKKLIRSFQSLKQQFFIKDFSLGIGLPVIGMIRKIDKSNCIITCGVATTREEALIRTLTENSQAEDKQSYKRISLSKHYFINDKIISMKDIPNIDNKNMKSELETIEKILNKQNMKIFFIDATDKALNIPSVMVYITGAKHWDKKVIYRNMLVGLIEECLETENYLEAERYVNMGKTIDYTNDIVYRYYKGIIFRRKKNYIRAIRYFQQVLSEVKIGGIGELKKLSLIELGLCYQAENKINKAIDCYLRTIDLYPDFRIEQSQYWYNVILLKRFSESKLLKEAKDLYLELLLARSHFAGTKLIDFKKMFEKYQKDKKTILDYLEKAQAYFVSKQYKETIREASKVIKLNHIAGKMHHVYLLLGSCYEKLKQYKKAISELKKAEKINPGKPQINFSLSNCYRNIGQTKQADRELDKGIIKYKWFYISPSEAKFCLY